MPEPRAHVAHALLAFATASTLAVPAYGQPGADGFVIVRDFNSGVAGGPVLGRPDGFDFTSTAVYDASHAYDGMSARDDLKGYAPQPPCSGADQFGGVVQLGPDQLITRGEEIWIRVRVRFPLGWDWGTDSAGLKFIRVSRQRAGWESDGRYDLYFRAPGVKPDHQMPFVISERAEPGTRLYFGNGTSDNPQLGVWETWEMYLNADDVAVDDGGRGRVRVWKNGVLLVDRTDQRTLNRPDDFFSDVLFNTYWNNPCQAPLRSQSVWMDDVRIQSKTPTARDTLGHPMIGP